MGPRWFHKRTVTVLTVVLATAVLAAPSLTYPFGFDQSNQAHLASLVLDGHTLFSDVPSLKPPFTIGFHAIALALFGHSMMAVRLLDLCCVALTALAIGACARRVWKTLPGVGMTCAIAYPYLYYCFSFWHTAQTDGWLNLPVALAVYLVLVACDAPAARTRVQLARWFGVGAFTVAALLFKYSAGGFVGVFGLAALACFIQGKRSGLLALSGFALGLFISIGLLVVVLFVNGAWHSFVYDHLATAVHYAEAAPSSPSGSPVGRMLSRLTDLGPSLEMLSGAPLLYWVGAVGVIVITARTLRRSLSLHNRVRLAFVLAWLGAGWMSTAVQGRFFGYHYLPVLPAWALCTGYLLAAAVQLVRNCARKRWLLGTLPMFALGVTWCERQPLFYTFSPVSARYGLLWDVARGKSIEDLWMRGPFEIAPNYSVRETVMVANFVRSVTTPGDAVFVWGSNQGIYFLAQRPHISLITTAYEASGQSLTAGAADGEQRLFDDMRRHAPKIVVVQHGDETPLIFGHGEDSYQLLARAPRIRDFLIQHFTLMHRIGRFDILVWTQ